MNCAGCHKEPLFTDNSYRNNGLHLNRFNDIGRMAITGKKADSLKFKVPTLRNIELSFPYMHDGHLYSLYHVINHYNTIDTSLTLLDPLLKKKTNFSSHQIMELISFLNTLTDSSFIKNPRYGISNTK